MGRLVRGDISKGFVPPVASAVLALLEKHGMHTDVMAVMVLAFLSERSQRHPSMQNAFVGEQMNLMSAGTEEIPNYH